MFDDDRKDFEDGTLTLLNNRTVEKAIGVESTKRPISLKKRLVKPAHDFILRDVLALGELQHLVPGIGCSADPREDKLVQVARQMQQQVTNAVVCFMSTPPDIVLRQFLHTLLHAWPVLMEEPEAAPLDIRCTKVAIHHSG